MLLYAGRIAPQPGWRINEHVHPRHDELIVVLGGELHVCIGGHSLAALPGQVLHYPAGESHIEQAAGELKLETLFVGFRAPARLALPRLSTDRDGHVANAVRWMIRLTASGSRADAAVAEDLLRAIFHEIGSGRNGGAGEDELLRRVQSFIEYNLASPLTLQDLADQAGLSMFHFARLFRRIAGQSPVAYVRAARVRAAKVLLDATNLPLRAIAPLVGFPDQSHFSRSFRRVTGQSPGGYRRSRLS